MNDQAINMNFQRDILLSDLTTIKLGGKAKFFYKCKSIEDLKHCLRYAINENISLQVIGGGSNIIFPDEGFNGIVIKIDIKGIELDESNDDSVIVKVGAGETWDDFVKLCIDKNLAGIECLSGIPGSVGATPIQNVGAYGQEVSETIVSVTALNRGSLEIVRFENKTCNFSYRHSKFKNEDKDKFIITEVTFKLNNLGEPKMKYTEIQKKVEALDNYNSLKRGKEKLSAVRNIVLETRKSKSMVIDKNDPNTISCGSFFTNPILSEKEFEMFEKICEKNKLSFPSLKTPDGFKIQAAWLIENSGFYKGFRKWGAGISENHSLALINCGGSTKELLELAEDIKSTVYNKFNIRLEKEPIIIRNT
jgi:UDP-N-acetylmuramate dehydrogenase